MHRLLFVAIALAAFPARANEQARARLEASVNLQKEAISRMEKSIGKMQAAIEKQRISTSRQPRPAGFAAEPAAVAVTWADPCAPMSAQELDPLVQWAARREGIQPALLRAVIERESGFRPCAVSPKGAMGLMQLMPGTAADLGVQDPFDPAENVSSGAAFLADLLRRYGNNPALALGAYNAGPGRVDANGGVPAIPETLQYVSDILSRLQLR